MDPLSEEQQALVGSLTDLLTKQATTERVRAAEPGGFDPGAVALAEEVGVVAMGVPETGRSGRGPSSWPSSPSRSGEGGARRP